MEKRYSLVWQEWIPGNGFSYLEDVDNMDEPGSLDDAATIWADGLRPGQTGILSIYDHQEGREIARAWVCGPAE
jgi:hypothetical protein